MGCGPYDARNAFLAVEGGRPVVLENLDCDRGCNPLLEIKQGLGPNLGGDTSMTPRHLSSRVSRFEKKITACRHQRERKIQFYESHLRKEKNQLAQDCETFSFTRVTCEKKNTTCPWIRARTGTYERMRNIQFYESHLLREQITACRHQKSAKNSVFRVLTFGKVNKRGLKRNFASGKYSPPTFIQLGHDRFIKSQLAPRN